MRERVTFVHPKGQGIPPENVAVKDAGLMGGTLLAAREDRITVLLHEIPAGMSQILGDLRDFHVRWVSTRGFQTLEPFSSRSSPGFHVSFTPLHDDKYLPLKDLCWHLETFGRLDCQTLDSFIKTPSGDDNGAPTFYLFRPMPDLASFIVTASNQLCEADDMLCHTRLRSLATASQLDVSFDNDSGVLKFAAFWPLREQVLNVPRSTTRQVEVGVLEEERPAYLEAHEVGYGGALTTLGDETQLAPIQFSVPQKDRLSSSFFSSSFDQPTGLHPNMKIRISSARPPTSSDIDGDASPSSCAPYAFLTLPKTIFADRYQFSDALFRKSKNLAAARYISEPVDLEAPSYTPQPWGSQVLMQLAPPVLSANSLDEAWTAEIPLHLRYQEPSPSGQAAVSVPYPAVFWACDGNEALRKARDPFARAGLGYDQFFDADTVFFHVQPRPAGPGDSLLCTSSMPVLRYDPNEEGMGAIGIGTAATVLLGTAWVFYKLLSVLSKQGYQNNVEAKKAKQQ